MSAETEQSAALSKLVAYLRRQGGQCNTQQPIVPVAGSELLKAADAIEATRAALDASGIGEMVEALEEARPWVAVAANPTSPRSVRLTVHALLAKIDAALSRARATVGNKDG